MNTDQTCRTCRHFLPSGKSEGQCRESPPQVVTIHGLSSQPSMVGGVLKAQQVPTTQIQAMFPPMLATDRGCGKHLTTQCTQVCEEAT